MIGFRDWLSQTEQAYMIVYISWHDKSIKNSDNNSQGLATELERQLEETGCKSTTELTKHIHFYPDLHGLCAFQPTKYKVTCLPIQETDHLLRTQR